MKLETAIELIREAMGIEAVYHQPYYDTIPNEISGAKHDACLKLARQILLEHMYERERRTTRMERKDNLLNYDANE